MASYSLLLALSGFHYSAPEKSIKFSPLVNQSSFACFFSVGSGWGMYRQNTRSASIEVKKGSLILKEIGLPFAADIGSISLAGSSIPPKAECCPSCEKCSDRMSVIFYEPIKINEGETLMLDFRC